MYGERLWLKEYVNLVVAPSLTRGILMSHQETLAGNLLIIYVRGKPAKKILAGFLFYE